MMPHRNLPRHPDLDQLKRQAKELLRSARARDPVALSRFRGLPAFAGLSPEELGSTLALHDAQSVIAREHGFASWNQLGERVAEMTLLFDDALREFVEAATDGRAERAARLLKLHPRIAGAGFHAALVLGDERQARQWLAEDASRARKPDGPRGWEPLLYICHTSLRHDTVGNPQGWVAIARQLLELGADPNTRFPWLHHGVRRPVLWGAIHVTRLLPLGELLLRAGANPNDGVTLPLAASGTDTAVLDLLLSYGADPNQAWASDGAAALYAVLQWATESTGIYWLLEHGADPDPVFQANGETPLHVVARRWDVPMAEALVTRGADMTRRRGDGRTPYAIAEINGNRAVADWLEGRGARTELPPVDRLVAACGRGERQTAQPLLAAHPDLGAEFEAEHYRVLYRAAERGDATALEALLACGFDPNRGDEEIGKTALHCAAMAGRIDAVRVLLAHGASPAIRDREFNATPLVWAAEGARTEGSHSSNHAQVGRMLLDAGSPTDWQPGEEPGEAILEIIDQWRSAPALRGVSPIPGQ
jgi:ankyrin repeat protein